MKNMDLVGILEVHTKLHTQIGSMMLKGVKMNLSFHGAHHQTPEHQKKLHNAREVRKMIVRRPFSILQKNQDRTTCLLIIFMKGSIEWH